MLFVFLMNGIGLKSQNVDLEKLGSIKNNKPVKFSGGVSANSIFYNGNGGTGRDPFIYYLNGNVNMNILGLIDLPFSFNITNYGAGFNYPTLPNRLCISPKYKWITAHIGDVNMTYSPYTLNGHLFRGAGVELDPKGSIKFSAMAGQFQRGVEYDPNNKVTFASYKRFGYGARLNFVKKRYKLGMIVFAAKDKVNSLILKPDSLNILPQQNLVVSWTGSVMPTKDLELTAEYATSALTRDLRDNTKLSNTGKSVLKGIFNTKNSTSFYNAIKANLNYKFKNKIIGVGYERIDPGYQTLGSYYFNNDLENITFNFAQPILKQKGNISGNFGYQHDNLDGKKFGSNKRVVYAINVNYTPNQKLYTTASYSNFQTFMYIRSQFQNINQFTQFQNIDTLNYSQISQNANFNVNYTFDRRTKKNQSVNVNLNYLDAADRQGGIVRFGNASQFFNLATSYTILFVPQSLSITAAYNASYNTIGKNEYLTLGPTVAVNSKLFKQISTSLSASYNKTKTSGVYENAVFNTRANFGYTLFTKHLFSLSLMDQWRDVKLKGNTNDIVVTLGYNYSF